MTHKLGIVMDPIAGINYKNDSSLALLWEAQARGMPIYYFEPKDIFFRDQKVLGYAKELELFHDAKRWFEFKKTTCIALSDLDVVLMRKDPPFNLEYIYMTYLLEHVEQQGVRVINKPQSLRDANEKLFTLWFPQCSPKTLVTRNISVLRNFFQEQKDIVCKPLDRMGGTMVFHLKYPDENASVVFETLTQQESNLIMAQSYIPEIKKGDKRILMINGESVPFALARVPLEGELRGNLAAGAHGVAQPLSERDRWICQQVGPVLREKGLYFVGLDVIGDFLTEINVTSPTCIRELDEQCGLNIAKMFWDNL